MEHIINKIKDIRKTKGYSHEYMAHLLHMSQAAYTKIEKAIGKITIEGEGFATRITNAPTYLTGAIFDVKSSYNTLKNMSIIS
jgi:transcriptional regulator with XRE-family HTH domain